MKKVSLICIAAFLFWGVQSAKAQDTIMVEVDEKTKILIYTSDKEAFDNLKNVDLNKIIQQVVSENKEADNAKIITYEYKVENKETVLEKKETMDVKEDWNWNVGFSPIKINKRYAVDFHLDLGLNGYLENGSFPDEQGKNYALKPLNSQYVAISSNLNLPIFDSKKSGRLAFNIGLELSWYNFRFTNSNYIKETATGVEFRDYVTDFNAGLSRSKLTALYLNIPIGFDYWTVNAKGRKRLHLGVGAFVGYKIHSYSKIEVNGQKSKDYNNFYLSNLHYGVEGQIGYRHWFDLFFRYDLNPLFADSKGPQLNAFSFGIRI